MADWIWPTDEWPAYLVGILYILFTGWTISGPVLRLWDALYEVDRMATNKPWNERDNRLRLAPIVGLVERPIYALVPLFAVPELAGIWLVLKAVVEWTRWKEPDGRHYFNVFIIGSGLSLLNGLAAGVMVLAVAQDRLADALLVGAVPIAISAGVWWQANGRYLSNKRAAEKSTGDSSRSNLG